jgi:hypothetical protein
MAVLVRKLQVQRPPGRHRYMYEDVIKRTLNKRCQGMVRIQLAEDRVL